MHKALLAVIFMFIGACLFAQDVRKTIDEQTKDKTIAADTAKKDPWKLGGNLSFNLTQQNNAYWIGVSETFALNVGLSADLYANYADERQSWVNTFKGAYGFQNNESQGLRKNADFFDIFSKYGYILNKRKTLSASGIVNLRSQFTNGYDYNKEPRRRVSGLFAPAYLLVTPGIDWRPNKHFTLFVSPLAARWVIVSNDPFSYSQQPPPPDEEPIALIYGVDPNRKVDVQLGAFTSASFNKDILKNVNYTSRLDLYSNYLNNPQHIDVFWTNSLLFKVNKLLTLSYQFNLAYDHDYTPEGESGPRTQFLSTFGIGVSGKF
jgi:hypothetical protein